MIVYSSVIWLKSTNSVDKVISLIANWLSKKTQVRISLDSLKEQTIKSFRDASELQVVCTKSEYPILYNFQYRQKDFEVSGRLWITEIGIEQTTPNGEIRCTFFVETSEISTMVEQKIQMTRPRIVADILDNCDPSSKTYGLSIKTLDNFDDVEAFAYEIEYSERKYPIVLVSPTVDGKYLVDIDYFFFQMKGLAEIVQIPIGLDTYKISNTIGKNHSAYHGAINILYPPLRKGSNTFVYTKLLIPEEIECMVTEGKKVESEILALIAHRTNLPNSWHHITSEIVKDSQRRREIEQVKLNAKESGQLQEYLKLFEEESQLNQETITKLQQELTVLKGDNEFYFSAYEDASESLREQKFKNDNLLMQLNELSTIRNQKSDLSDCSPEFRDLLSDFIENNLTPYKCLEFIKRIFPERIVVLESAKKSAKESENFQNKKKVFELLWKLTTDYWEALCSGQGDNRAKSIFGNDYAAKESETVEKNKTARSKRTFLYEDREIEMMKHLKHGVKNSVDETIRIHFEWESSERRIIIGYCGPHLDFN